MKRTVTLTLALLLGGALATTGQDTRSAEQAAIVQVALDYIEGWYEGDAERLERALHPELAKRALLPVPGTGSKHLQQMSALSLAVAITSTNYNTAGMHEQARRILTDIIAAEDRRRYSPAVPLASGYRLGHYEIGLQISRARVRPRSSVGGRNADRDWTD